MTVNDTSTRYVICYLPLNKPFGRDIALGLQRAAGEHDNIDLWRGTRETWRYASGLDPIPEEATSNMPRVDAAIGYFPKDLHAGWLAGGKPIVNLSRARARERPDTVSALLDDRMIGCWAADHLLAAGYSSFAVLDPGKRLPGEARRRRGFIERIESIQGQPVGTVTLDPGAIRALPKPCGVFASLDLSGWRLGVRCKEMGIAIPGELGIIVADDDPLYTQIPKPTLSAIELPGQVLGERALHTLVEIMEGKPPQPTIQFVQPEKIITRQSTDIYISDSPIVAKAVQYIRKQARAGIRAQDVADHVGVSRKSLEALFKRRLEHSPAAELRRVRVHHAMRLLSQGELKLLAIAIDCGFQTVSGLNKAFLAETGRTIAQHRGQRQA